MVNADIIDSCNIGRIIPSISAVIYHNNLDEAVEKFSSIFNIAPYRLKDGTALFEFNGGRLYVVKGNNKPPTFFAHSNAWE